MFISGVRSTFGYYYLQQRENKESFLIDPNWYWNFEISKIPLKLKSSTTTCQFSVSFFSRKSLDYVAKPGWNSVYKMDILSDIRLATILNYGNVNLQGWNDDLGYILIDHLPISKERHPVVIERLKGNEPGIYHPVKQPVESLLT